MIAAQNDDRLHLFYLDAPSDNFLDLYKERFLPKLPKKEVVRRVEDCYSDLLATEMEGSNVTKRIGEALRSKQIRLQEVIENIGLMESVFTRRLGVRLKEITEKEDFATALLLLLRPEFEDAVWEWLAGNEPDAVLKERGISRTIDNDAAALEAIGVKSFLFGYLGHSFILVIDEMEKVLVNLSNREGHE